MEKQVISQTDFSGGMDSSKDADAIGENQYADAKNVEIRDGAPRTRRGSILLYDWGDSYALQGAGIYQAVFGDQRKETLLFVRNGTCYRMNVPQGAVSMTTPSGETITTDEDITFVQAFDYIYMLRGNDKPVLRWSGYNTDNWELVPTPAVGDPFPNCSLGVYAYNRGWVVTADDTLNASDLLSEAFDFNFHSYQIDSGDGGKITGILPYMDGGLLVLKEGSVHILTGCNGDLSGLARQVVDSRHGCIAPDSIVMLGADVWFLSRDGVRSVQLTEYNKAQMMDVTVSNKIPTLIDRINWNSAQGAQAIVYDNYFLLAVPFDNATTNDTILVYDMMLRTWVGYWQGVTVQKFLVGKQDNLDVLYAIDQYNDTRIMLRDFYQDNTRKMQPVYYQFLSPKSSISLSPLVNSGQLSALTSGIIAFDMVIFTGATGTILNIVKTLLGANRFHIDFSGTTMTVTLSPTGGAWSFTATIPTYSTPSIQDMKRILIKHNGTEPEMWIDGVKQTLTFTVSTDKTKWLPDISADASYMILGRYGTSDAIQAYIKNFDIYNDDGTTRTYICRLPFLEGSGTSVKELSTLQTFTCGNNWVAPAVPVAIPTSFTSRGYNFGASQVSRSLKMGQVCVRHRQPNFTVTLTDDREYESQVLLNGKTYSLTKYDIHGVADWAQTGVDFATAKRQDYAPLYLPAAGMKLESLANVSYNVKPDLEQEHTEVLFSGRVCSFFQLAVENTTGTLALKEISMQATPNMFGRKAQE